MKKKFFLAPLALAGCLQMEFKPGSDKSYEPIPEDPRWRLEEKFSEAADDKDRLKIAIVSHYTTDEQNMGFIKMGTKNHIRYSRENGYDYYFRNGTITEKFFWPEGPNRTLQLGLYWQKIEAVRELLNQKKAEEYVYDYVLWIDTDAVFTNLGLSLERVIEDAGSDKYLIIADDLGSARTIIPRSCVNTGTFLVKNDVNGRNFIDEVAGVFDIYKDTIWPEQLATADVAYGHISSEQGKKYLEDPKSLEEFKAGIFYRDCYQKPLEGVAILRMKFFNAGYPYSYWDRVKWDKNSLVAHFLGLGGKRVSKYMKTFLTCLEKLNYKNREQCSAQNLNIMLLEQE